MNFDDFIIDWCTRNADQITPQYNRFVDLKGRIFANYIISFPNLELGFELVKSALLNFEWVIERPGKRLRASARS